ncbi:MAG: methionyl-tRNA formyltransferase [Clostridia bacterium]|nr:methionyl-tRNA formyltransferase [Clostridia bacterium]MBQ5905537.1 methionyl-tRNA formyltransferase [Clostridia bacterium]
MRIAFMGTPDFAVDCLRALAESEHEVVGVFCQPDKPVGRKQELTPPDVKVEALKHNLPVFQPVSLRNGKGVEILEEIKPDLVIVVAYGKILPDEFLTFPKYGCINIHASILPKYRGASPIHFAVLNGDKETGVTSMQMDSGLDTGDILLVKKAEIGINDTTEKMYEILAPLGAEVLMETIDLLEKGMLSPVKQDDSQATKVGLLSKDMSPIDWTKSAFEIHNKIRGLYSWPGASTTLNGKTLKIHSSVLSTKKGHNNPGEVVDTNGTIVVSCGDGNCVELTVIQLEGKKRMDSSAFLNGYQLPKGTILGK